MMSCIAVDDEPLALDILENYISQVPNLDLKGTFTDAISAWGFLQKNSVDLVFLDVQMPDITGTQLARSLKKRQPMIIFTTAYSKYAVEGFNLDAVDYLLKPFDFNRFLESVNRAAGYKSTQERSTVTEQDSAIFVKSDYQNVRINTRDIIYIEGLDDYIRIHVENGKSIYTLMSLKSILDKLDKICENDFIRIHRSYIVSVKKIKRIYNQMVLVNDKELPIGKSYTDEVKKIIS